MVLDRLLPPALALLAGVRSHVMAVADMSSHGGSAGFPARPTSRSRCVGGVPGTLSL